MYLICPRAEAMRLPTRVFFTRGQMLVLLFVLGSIIWINSIMPSMNFNIATFEKESYAITRSNTEILHLISNNNVTSKFVGFPELNNSNCSAAFLGTVKNADFKQQIRRWNLSRIRQDARDCDYFRKEYGFERYPSALEEEREFPLAFSTVFHKDFDQVLYLLRAVYRPHNLYCLHVDSKQDPLLKEAAKVVAKCFPNMFIASKLEDVVYASYSRLQADLTCMNDSLRMPVKWRYFINMVGQQFPLRTNLEIVRVLKLFNGSNDVEGIVGERRRTGRFHLKYGLQRDAQTNVVTIGKVGGTNPPIPHGLEVVKGSVFGSFSRAFVEYLMKNPIVRDVLQWSRSVYSPDEYVWATLHYSKVLQAPGGYIGEPDPKEWINTYANWLDLPCSSIKSHGICIFAPEDLPLLLSRREFFANKLYITNGPAALHCLDKFIYSLTVSNTVRDLDVYKKLKIIASKRVR